MSSIARPDALHDSLGVYLSIPFCKAKCSFCNFASDAFGLERLDGYLDRLCAEIHAARANANALNTTLPTDVDTIYFGGGTPSLLTGAQLDRIFAALRANFEIDPAAEITFECAPGQLSDETLAAARSHGVNRISLGIQSFVDAETRAVGRLHTAEMCLAEVERLRTAGIASISLDLIAGLPGQTATSWEHSLETLLATKVGHASVYMLEVDDDSRLGKELIAGGPRYGATVVPTDEAMTDFYARACETFASNGLTQYEISNFACPGQASRHNLKYWQRAPYLGFGLDAHSMLHRADSLEAVRFANPADLGAYTNAASREITEVDTEAAFEESLFLGLRRNMGVDLNELEAIFGRSRVQSLTSTVDTLITNGLLNRQGTQIQLTDHGRMVSNEVFAELLGVFA
jgi:oxygen-independent coproporphyrinogen-3 oxidase